MKYAELDHITLVRMPDSDDPEATTPAISNLDINGIHPSDLYVADINTVTKDIKKSFETWYDPIFCDDTFTSGSSQLRLQNHAEFALRAKMRIYW